MPRGRRRSRAGASRRRRGPRTHRPPAPRPRARRPDAEHDEHPAVAVGAASSGRAPVSALARGGRGRHLLERHVGVGEPLAVDRRAATRTSAWIGSLDVPDVDVHAGDDALAAQPEGDELARRRVAAEDDARPQLGSRSPRTPSRRRTGRRRSTGRGRRLHVLAEHRCAPRPGPGRARWPSARRGRAGRRPGARRWRRRRRRRRSARSSAGARRRATPLSTSRPAASASSTRGATPTPTTTRSQSIVRPSASRTRSRARRRPRSPRRPRRAAARRRGRAWTSR